MQRRLNRGVPEQDAARGSPASILVALDGPGADTLLDGIAPELRASARDGKHDGWTVIHFDAWEFQRVEPPWWWLVEAFDRQVRLDLRARGRWAALREEGRRLLWRSRRIATDPAVVIALLLVVVGILFFTLSQMRSAVETTAQVTASVLAVAGLVAAVTKAFRRQVLFSRGNEKAVLRASDPMKAFQDRYAFLLRARTAPVAFLVENLDRCRASCVVEFLEGIQTLPKHRPVPTPSVSDRLGRSARAEAPLVAFLVAADQRWLCNSFVDVYKDVGDSVAAPGRPSGLAFLDKVFDYYLHLPEVPAVPAMDEDLANHCSLAEDRLGAAKQELAIRRIVCAAEQEARPAGSAQAPVLQRVRVEAVRVLGKIEDLFGDQVLCSDSTWQLTQLATHLDAAADVPVQLRTAYCAQRTAQLLGGHEVESDPHSIGRLGLWALLKLNWPLLAQHLTAFPEDVRYLMTDEPLPDRAVHLAAVFANRSARQVAAGFPGQAVLTATVIKRFTVPLPRPDPCMKARGPAVECDAHDQPRAVSPVGSAGAPRGRKLRAKLASGPRLARRRHRSPHAAPSR